MMSEQMQPLRDGAGGPIVAETGPLVHFQLAPSRMLWRICPAWAVVAGAVAAGAPLGSAVSLLRLGAAIILADLIWGILRRIIPASPGTEGTGDPVAPSLPFGSSDAPLARFIQMTAADPQVAPASWLSWLSGLALTAVLSLLLGVPALLISALAVGLVFLTRGLFRSGRRPALCLALLDVALPWVLGAALVWPGVKGETLFWFLQTVMLGAAYTVIQWALYRARLSAGRHLAALYLGQAALLGVLILLRQPDAVVVAALLCAPPIWWLARGGEAEVALARSLPWWWASMFLVAAIVR
jgi:hypothetical protein